VIFNLLPWKQTQLLFYLQQHLTFKKNVAIDETCVDPTMTTLIVMEGCLNEKSTPAT
jgi:hypothetical protein